jgi:hypothetical protein
MMIVFTLTFKKNDGLEVEGEAEEEDVLELLNPSDSDFRFGDNERECCTVIFTGVDFY